MSAEAQNPLQPDNQNIHHTQEDQVRSLSELLQAEHDHGTGPNQLYSHNDGHGDANQNLSAYMQAGSSAEDVINSGGGTGYPAMEDMGDQAPYFDGSAMIHAAFAAQAIEMAQREAEDKQREHDELYHPVSLGAAESFGSHLHDESPYVDRTSTGYELHEPSTSTERPAKKRKTGTGTTKRTKAKAPPNPVSQPQHDSLETYQSDQLAQQNASNSSTPAEILQTEQQNFLSSQRRAAQRRQAPVDDETRKQSHTSAEQKRRDAIKSGYEALYRVIPALRDVELREGKGRGGSGPGGGGGFSIKDRAGEEGEDDMYNLSSKRKRPKMSGSTTPLDGDIQNPLDTYQEEARNYPLGQQYDELGKPIRPGVRPVFPLIRQPGSEVIDGRQGPRSESVVLQKTVQFLRRQQAIRLHMMQRLNQLRELSTRVFPSDQHNHLGLEPRLVEAEIDLPVPPNKAKQSHRIERPRPRPRPFSFDAPIYNAQDRLVSTGFVVDPSFAGESSYGGHGVTDGRAGETGKAGSGGQEGEVDELMEDGHQDQHSHQQSDPHSHSHFPGTLEAVLANEYHQQQEHHGDYRDHELDHPTETTGINYIGNGAGEKDMSTSIAASEVSEPSRHRALVNWEGEWEGAAFLEGDDLD